MSVQSLLSYALTVPDLETGRKFYGDFGLLPQERDGVIACRCEGREQDQVLLVEGPRKRLHHLRFGSDAAGVASIRTRLKQHGVAEIEPPHRAFAGGQWFRDPDGHAVNLREEPAKPWRAAPPLALNNPGHYTRTGRGCPPRGRVRPHRLGHVLLHTPDPARMLAFYSDVLGLRLTDRVPGIIAFMHLPGGGDHHVLALLKDERPGFHHASFEVGSLDEIGLGAQAMLEAGYRDGWGLGRHVLGSNFFHYLRDPWNSLAEYFCDIDQIPADGSWRAQDWGVEDSLYRWGPPLPKDFSANFEAKD